MACHYYLNFYNKTPILPPSNYISILFIKIIKYKLKWPSILRKCAPAETRVSDKMPKHFSLRLSVVNSTPFRKHSFPDNSQNVTYRRSRASSRVNDFSKKIPKTKNRGQLYVCIFFLSILRMTICNSLLFFTTIILIFQLFLEHICIFIFVVSKRRANFFFNNQILY